MFPNRVPADVEAFRDRWDPLAVVLPAHITLVHPTTIEPSELTQALHLAAQRVSAFRFAFTRPHVHDCEYVCLTSTQGGNQVQGLHTLLYRAIGVPAPAWFLPHLTIARQSDVKAVEQARAVAASQGLRVEGWAKALSSYRIGPDGRRHREVTVPLSP